MNPPQLSMRQVPTANCRTTTHVGHRWSLALGKVNLLLSVLGLVFISGAYWLNLLPEALAVLLLVVPPVAVASRVRHARRGQLHYGLLRHPFRRDLRPALLQCLNQWLLWALFGAAMLAGTFTLVPAQIGSLLSLPLPDRIPYQPLLILLGLGALVMALLALLPRYSVQIATNVLVATGSAFLAVQLVRVYLPPADPVIVSSPLMGEWHSVAAGRSLLVSHHYTNKTRFVKHAFDFVRLVDGQAFDGDRTQAKSWYGFGQPVLAPADGTVVSVSDILPDEPIGNTGMAPPYGNHIVLDMGDHHYAVLAHLKQGSAYVGTGDRVRLGQQIAAIGDSGNSLWPHLHFHVQNSPKLDMQARTVPVVFRDVVLARNGRVTRPAAADLRRGDDVVAHQIRVR